MRRNCNSWYSIMRTSTKRRLPIYRRSTNFWRRNLWRMRWSPRTRWACCSMSSSWRLRRMKVWRRNILSRRCFINEKRLNLCIGMSSWRSRWMRRGKPCRRGLRRWSGKRPRLRNNWLHLHIRRMRRAIWPKQRMRKLRLSKRSLLRLWKSLKEQDSWLVRRNHNCRMSLWTRLSTTRRRSPWTSRRMNSCWRRTNNWRSSPRTRPKLMRTKYKLSR